MSVKARIMSDQKFSPPDEGSHLGPDRCKWLFIFQNRPCKSMYASEPDPTGRRTNKGIVLVDDPQIFESDHSYCAGASTTAAGGFKINRDVGAEL